MLEFTDANWIPKCRHRQQNLKSTLPSMVASLRPTTRPIRILMVELSNQMRIQNKGMGKAEAFLRHIALPFVQVLQTLDPALYVHQAICHKGRMIINEPGKRSGGSEGGDKGLVETDFHGLRKGQSDSRVIANIFYRNGTIEARRKWMGSGGQLREVADG